MSVRGYYLDKMYKMQSVIFPQVVKLPNGKDFIIRGGDYAENLGFNEATIAGIINSSPKIFNGGTRGLITFAMLAPDVNKYKNYLLEHYESKNLPEPQTYFLTLIGKYNKSWKREVSLFLTEGIPPSEVMFPVNIAFGSGQTSTLSIPETSK